MQLKELKRLHYLFSIEFLLKYEKKEIRELLYMYFNEQYLRFFLQDKSDFDSKKAYQQRKAECEQFAEFTQRYSLDELKDKIFALFYGVKYSQPQKHAFFKRLSAELKRDYQYENNSAYIDDFELLEPIIEVDQSDEFDDLVAMMHLI